MKLLEFNIEQEYFIGILGNYLPKRNGGIEISEVWLIYKKERKKMNVHFPVKLNQVHHRHPKPQPTSKQTNEYKYIPLMYTLLATRQLEQH